MSNSKTNETKQPSHGAADRQAVPAVCLERAAFAGRRCEMTAITKKTEARVRRVFERTPAHERGVEFDVWFDNFVSCQIERFVYDMKQVPAGAVFLDL
ncbi:MAG: hypothetical protein K9M45_06880 [Kiritimatiellales bacterium]|nr:hypothetical protein [Kiritimatiellales bacterium]